MTTTPPMFETTRRHTALGFIVIATLCISLAAGFFAAASKQDSKGSANLRANAPVSSLHHAS